jgi:hypothetical protein
MTEKADSLLVTKWRLILGQESERHGLSLPGFGGIQGQGGQGIPQLGEGQGTGGGASGERKRGRKGKGSNGVPGLEVGAETLRDIDQAVNFVYQPPGTEKRGADLGGSQLTIPLWLDKVSALFPRQAKEILEKDFIRSAPVSQLLDHPELMEKVEPTMDMVKVILALKNKLPDQVKSAARLIVRRVVEQLTKVLKQAVLRALVGKVQRTSHTPVKSFRNIDWKRTIRRNLKNYDSDKRQIVVTEPVFYNSERKDKAWHIITLMDESGSMVDSVIYASILASIFASIPSFRASLAAFDTQVVDLSHQIHDPVDVLMSVQLGGGTDITNAVRYAHGLVKDARKTLDAGLKVLGVAALGSDARPNFNYKLSKEMNKIGIDVVYCTPEHLPEIMVKLLK